MKGQWRKNAAPPLYLDPIYQDPHVYKILDFDLEHAKDSKMHVYRVSEIVRQAYEINNQVSELL